MTVYNIYSSQTVKNNKYLCSPSQPSLNVRHITDSIYPSDMMDDSISKMDQTRIQFIAPGAEEAVIFFGCAIHRACNPSNLTRFSLDIRLRSAQISDGENEFYKPFCRGLIGKCVTKFLSASSICYRDKKYEWKN